MLMVCCMCRSTFNVFESVNCYMHVPLTGSKCDSTSLNLSTVKIILAVSYHVVLTEIYVGNQIKTYSV